MAESDEVRIGTKEREEAASILGEHYSEGRLTGDEYETRVQAAYGAITLADLRPLFRDLPTPHPPCLTPPPVPPSVFYPPPMPVTYSAPMPMPMPISPKSKTVAGVLQILLPMGIGRFYTGQVGLALAQLFVCLITFGFGAIWSIIDGILLLANGGRDAYGRPLSP